jgi:hypothetical protein
MTMKKLARAIAVVCALAVGGAVYAQTPPPQKDAEGFEPVNGDMMQKGESIPASRLVAAAYGFICVAIVAWVASVVMRTRRVEDELDALQRKLDRAVSGDGPPPGGA